MRSPLASVISTGSADPPAARRLARDAYQAVGFVAIDPAWLASSADRQALTGLAEKVHGRRPAR